MAANLLLLLCSLVVATSAWLLVHDPGAKDQSLSSAALSQIETNVRKDIDAEYAELMRQAKLAIEHKEGELRRVRQTLLAGYAVAREFVVTETDSAYWLVEPKLMLGVTALSGGTLHVHFSDRDAMISVGERIDFHFDSCDCFLILKSSVRGAAEFIFACEPDASRRESGGELALLETGQ